MTPTHDQFTLLYEDENTKVLHEFKAVVADDVITHLVDFLKGCGYMESSIFECMKESSEAVFRFTEVLQTVRDEYWPPGSTQSLIQNKDPS
jgi:hypothetical protein